MAPPAEKPKSGFSLTTLIFIALVFVILFNPDLRDATGNAVGFVLMPIIGFGGEFPVLTIMIAGGVMVLLTTVLRHFTTDWLEMAKNQAAMKHFQKEFSAARKENNTYKVKVLTEKQPEVLQMQQKMSAKQMKSMPVTMIVVIPLFAWLFTFIDGLDYWFFSTPWNPTVDMFATNGILFGSSLFPHWILLYMTLSVPLGALVQKGMKYVSWKERWKEQHPEVHE